MAGRWAVCWLAAFAIALLLREACAASHDAEHEAEAKRPAAEKASDRVEELEHDSVHREDRLAEETEAAHTAGDHFEEEEEEHGKVHREGEPAEELSEEEEGEEGPASTTDLEVACMLLGAVTLVVSLFYLVNWPDDDIRYYTWSIISMTISIFSAVLLFHGISEMFEYLTASFSQWSMVVFHYIHCTAYFVAMQLVIGYEAGMIGEEGYTQIDLDQEKWTLADGMRADYGHELTPAQELRVRSHNGKRSHIQDDWGNEVPVVKRNLAMEQRKRRMKCFAGLLSHLAAFATIDAGGVLMHTDVFSASPLMAFIAAATTSLLVIFYFWLSFKFRDAHMKAAKQAGRQGRRAAMCQEYVVDAENDIFALSSSFLLIQVIRFQISGLLPDSEGIERPELPHDAAVVIHLFIVGLICVASSVAFSVIVSRMSMQQEEEEPGNILRLRILNTCMLFSGMGFAWCTLWGVRWICVIVSFIDMETMIGRIECALILCVFSGSCVMFLDVISDSAKGSGFRSVLAIETLIEALALLIGFSWEQCFAHGVSVVSSRTPHAHLTKLGLGFAVLLLLVRPWRRYILTKVMYLEEYRKTCGQDKLDDSRPLSSRDLARHDGKLP